MALLVPSLEDAAYSLEAVLAAGVIEEEAELVVALWREISADARRYAKRAGSTMGALCEPLMLVRFVRAREKDVAAAATMYRESLEWREVRIPLALHELGAFAEGEDVETWSWRPHGRPEEASSVRGELGLRHGHARRLLDIETDDGAPVLVWRLGRLDIGGAAREGIEDALSMAQVAHLEDSLETVRLASNRAGRLVRARVIVDLKGLRLNSALANFPLVKRMLSVSKRYFPEITASVTCINAPFGFQTIWNLISLLLNDHMRSKVQILGSGDHTHALQQHVRVADVERLPKAVGGAASDADLAPCLPVPKGAGIKLEAEGTPPFL